MNVRLFIHGIEYTDCADDLDNVKIRYSKQDDKLVEYSLSGDIDVTGRAYRFLFNAFYEDPCEGRESVVPATLILDCCGEEIEFDFYIDFLGVYICIQDCTATIELKSTIEHQECYEYLRDTPYFFNDFNDIQSPKVLYAVQRGDIFFKMMLLSFLAPILLFLEVVEEVLKVMVSTLLAIGSFFNLITNAEKELLEGLILANLDVPSFDNYIAWVTGIGNYHFAPYFRDIFNHNIDTANDMFGCSMELKAPLLQEGTYANLALFQAIRTKGRSCANAGNNQKFETRNAYNRTALQLAEELADVFRMEVVITPQGQLCIDTHENITNNAVVLFNAEREFEIGNAEVAPCYNYIDKEYCRISSWTMAQDANDTEGNRLLPVYSDDVVWADELQKGIEGSCQHEFPFGAARFQWDIETARQDGFWDSDLLVDRMRGGNTNNGIIDILYDLTNFPCLPQDGVLIMSGHTASLPKLLVLEDGADLNDAKVVRRVSSTVQGTTFYDYNFPMHIDVDANYQELVQNHLERDSPFHVHNRIIEMQPFTVDSTPEMLQDINDNGLFVGVSCRYGVSMPTEIEIDPFLCTVTFSGLKYKCSD